MIRGKIEGPPPVIEKKNGPAKSFVVLVMTIFTRKATPLQLQLMVWVFVFLINLLSVMAEDGFRQAIIYTMISTFFYAIIIYGNISFLFPRLYEKGRIALYVVVTALFLTGVGLARTFLGIWIYNRYFAEKPEAFTAAMAVYISVTGVVVYILSFVFRIAIAYFRLKQQAEQMQEQKSLAELNLLKSQVQPHFLFNTLNNIYYEAFREAPRTALLIGRLSDIMRYFVEESPKERVLLTAEIQFLENYIALEKIRIRHGVKVAFHKEYEGEPTVPPMLLMTFVENIFKHGIDRSAADNQIHLSLVQKDGTLIFQTENSLQDIPVGPAKEGFGLKNLEKRLTLLFGDRFELHTARTGSFFQAYLKIPLP
ncbi:MAG TPA: histidine kinase [Puia sp.]|jgi:sensor histidine kinase YesM